MDLVGNILELVMIYVYKCFLNLAFFSPTEKKECHMIYIFITTGDIHLGTYLYLYCVHWSLVTSLIMEEGSSFLHGLIVIGEGRTGVLGTCWSISKHTIVNCHFIAKTQHHSQN